MESTDLAPWTAALVAEIGITQIKCMATILNARIVITSRKCFASSIYDVRNRFYVIVGNYTIPYGNPSHGYHIANIYPSLDATDQKPFEDLALVVLVEPIQFNSHVAPICMPYGMPEIDETDLVDLPVELAQYELKRRQAYPEYLLHVRSVKVHSSPVCDIEEITDDQICVTDKFGHTDDDSNGAGLVIRQNVQGKEKHFLYAVATSKPSYDKSPAFTKIYPHLKVLEKIETKFRPGNFEKLHLDLTNLPTHWNYQR